MLTRSKESLVCIGDEVADTDDAEDFEEWPRDQNDGAGDVIEEIDRAEVCWACAIVFLNVASLVYAVAQECA